MSDHHFSYPLVQPLGTAISGHSSEQPQPIVSLLAKAPSQSPAGRVADVAAPSPVAARLAA